MAEIDKCIIPVTFLNLYTRRRLAGAVLSALPAPGDIIYLLGQGYEVAHCEWTILPDESAAIVVLVKPELDAVGRRPFSHEEEEK